MVAIIAGATGLTGSCLLQLLLQEPSYTRVIAILRNPINNHHPKLQQLMVNFDHLEKHADMIKGDVVFCALGTTRRKTPDKNQYRKIDYQYPLDIAAIAYKNGARQYHLISALGADEHSRIFYSKLKGEVERDLKQFPFKSIHIYRPSLLVGNRKEQRIGEKMMIVVMKVINPLLTGKLKQYRSIKIEKLASAMVSQSLKDQHGIFIYPSDEIAALG